VYKEEGEPEEIKQLYQNYHLEDDFVVDADLKFMLRYLYRMKKYGK